MFGLGVFDGVHRGHRRIISEVVRLAAERGAVPAALTFDPHPRAVLCPDDPPQLLLPLGRRIEKLHCAGAIHVGVIEFSPAFAALAPEDFLDSLLRSPQFELAGVCAGQSWRFGRFGSGNSEVLRRFAEGAGLGFSTPAELEMPDRTVVSSTAIRHAAAAGKLAEAAAMLGEAPRLFGRVVRGYRIAGRCLSTPTANLQVAFGVTPPDGVYAAAAPVGGCLRPAVINIGFAPTFNYDQPERRVEVHVLDYDGDLYGAEIEVRLLRFLRGEICFPSAEMLKLQIIQDIAAARQEFGRAVCPEEHGVS